MEYKIKEYTILIDDGDFNSVNNIVWTPTVKTNGIYFRNTTGGSKYLHQHILGITDGLIIDHINRNTLDNRRINLRHASQSINAYNSKLSSRNTSGYRGISFCNDRKKWEVRMVLYKKRVYFGQFDNIDDAINIIDKINNKMFGNNRRECNWDIKTELCDENECIEYVLAIKEEIKKSKKNQ